MSHENRAELVELGLSPTEAQVYLALLQNPLLSASAIAAATELSRSRVYQTLCSLADKGLVESGAGYGSKFVVVAPDQAFPAFIARERESLAQREDLAGRVGQRLSALVEPGESTPDDSVQVIRTRQLIGERLHRLQLEAKRLVEGIVKAPILVPSSWDLAQRKAMKHGVRYKALYERAALDDPQIAPYIDGWLAGGEEARVFDGELPYKFFVFDDELVVSTLVWGDGRPTALLVRHPPYARSMSILFNFFWNQAKPLVIGDQEAANKTSAKSAPKADQASQRISHNGRRGQRAKV
jgi:sugar-specific transcriptional regulator TrmB